MSQDTKIIFGIILATLLIIAGGVIFLNRSQTSPQSKPVDESVLIKDDSAKISTSSATSTLVEFADYQCPACASFHPIVQKVLEEQPSLNYIFRHYPLPQHAHAKTAAYAVEAAGKQGKYWQLHDKIFDTQKEWEESKDAKEIFLKYASELNINIDQMKKDMDATQIKEKIQRDIADANTLGVDSTPTFYMNGIKMENIATYDAFAQQVRDLLHEDTKKESTSSPSAQPT